MVYTIIYSCKNYLKGFLVYYIIIIYIYYMSLYCNNNTSFRDTNQKSASINDKKLEYSITQRKQIMINSDKIINTG